MDSAAFPAQPSRERREERRFQLCIFGLTTPTGFAEKFALNVRVSGVPRLPLRSFLTAR